MLMDQAEIIRFAYISTNVLLMRLCVPGHKNN
jgi:hypothetical protein